jgi:pyruvate dehydrogenase E1 component beta subunit
MDGSPITLDDATFAEAIRDGFRHLLSRHANVFAIGQGLWSPWYVGATMSDLDTEFGVDRVIDTPVSELACTGAAVGAALCGYRPIVIHPRMDFMLLATDQIVNQAAKWSHMMGGAASPAVTFRAIINRGGEQGAQHSQALHAWFAHIPGLRVVMPSTPRDARDLLIAAVLSDDPVLYIDDRWLYDRRDRIGEPVELAFDGEGPELRRAGDAATLVGAGHASYLCEQAADELARDGIAVDVVDLRVLNPLDPTVIIESVRKTGRLLAVDGGWRTCGMAGEVIAAVAEAVDPSALRCRPVRLTLPDAPAPTSKPLEQAYYPTVADVAAAARALVAS